MFQYHLCWDVLVVTSVCECVHKFLMSRLALGESDIKADFDFVEMLPVISISKCVYNGECLLVL